MRTTQTLLVAVALCTGLLSASGANAALESRLGGQAVYDSDLNITWLANANLAASNTFGVSGIRNGVLFLDGIGIGSGTSIDGQMGQLTAQSWIAAMNASNGGAGYLGYNDWRLPTGDTCYGYNCTSSEMGHLFYNELGGAAGSSILGSVDPDLALFSNLQSNSYWSGTMTSPNSGFARLFNFYDGFANTNSIFFPMYALAVRDGQVAAVPVPAAAWLLGSGLLGLMGVARRRLATR